MNATELAARLRAAADTLEQLDAAESLGIVSHQPLSFQPLSFQPQVDVEDEATRLRAVVRVNAAFGIGCATYHGTGSILTADYAGRQAAVVYAYTGLAAPAAPSADTVLAAHGIAVSA